MNIRNGLFSLCLMLYSPFIFASGTDMPWEAPLEKILNSLTGPVAKIIGIIAIMLAGFGIAFGESGSGVRRILQVVFGLSIAFTSTSILGSLFGLNTGASF